MARKTNAKTRPPAPSLRNAPYSAPEAAPAIPSNGDLPLIKPLETEEDTIQELYVRDDIESPFRYVDPLENKDDTDQIIEIISPNGEYVVNIPHPSPSEGQGSYVNDPRGEALGEYLDKLEQEFSDVFDQVLAQRGFARVAQSITATGWIKPSALSSDLAAARRVAIAKHKRDYLANLSPEQREAYRARETALQKARRKNKRGLVEPS